MRKGFKTCEFIAESDEAFLTIIQAYLQRFGLEVAIASDSLECRAILRDFAPDVLVLDCELLWAKGVVAEMANDQVLQTVRTIHMRSISNADFSQEFSDL